MSLARWARSVSGEGCEIRSLLQLLRDVKDRAKEVGERLVLEEVRVLEEAQEEVAPPEQEVPERREVHTRDVHLVLAGRERAARPSVLVVGPAHADHEFGADGRDLGVGRRDECEKTGSHLAVKRPDDHVQLLEPAPSLTRGQEAVQDERDDQYLDGEEGDVSDEVDEDVVAVPEDQEVRVVEDRGRRDERRAENEEPARTPHLYRHLILPHDVARTGEFVHPSPSAPTSASEGFPALPGRHGEFEASVRSPVVTLQKSGSRNALS